MIFKHRAFVGSRKKKVAAFLFGVYPRGLLSELREVLKLLYTVIQNGKKFIFFKTGSRYVCIFKKYLDTFFEIVFRYKLQILLRSTNTKIYENI